MKVRKRQVEIDARAIWQAGVDAVRAETLVAESVRIENDMGTTLLCLGDDAVPLSEIGRLLVVGAGKAGSGMVYGLASALTCLAKRYPEIARIQVNGLISVPEGTLPDRSQWAEINPHFHSGIALEAGRPAGVNEPTDVGVSLARQMMTMVRNASSEDVCLALISGGGSALLPLPVDGISLADKLSVIRHLSAAGADIESLNVVRKHLSAVKGGKLAAACRAGRLCTLVISDVLGDPLDLIASGPTVVDTSTPEDALRVLRELDVEGSLPPSVYRVLEQATRFSRGRDESVGEVTVIGNNAVAVDAAGVEAERRGYSHMMHSSTRSEGSAESVGRQLAETVLMMLRGGSEHEPDCIITGGEPVVKLPPLGVRGRGGRNQQLVLAALARFMEEPAEIQSAIQERVCVLSGGTDGEDGPTNAAGAWLDGQVWERAKREGLDVADHLQRCDAYSFFNRAGGLLVTGPTGTNVCDVRVATLARES